MRKVRLSAALRRLVVERARGCCEYCLSQANFSTQPFSVEHIFPLDKGGLTESDNLALSCQGCNNHKYNKTEGIDPITRQMVELYHPRRQAWSDHFAWNDDYTLILGLTPTGRATVETLHLNRTGIVNLRRVLYAVRQHPPDSQEN